MRKIIIIALLLISNILVFGQASTMLSSTRDYIYNGRPSYFVMLAGATGLSMYKTSIDSLFLNHYQINGLSTVASTGNFSDLIGSPNLSLYLLKSDTSSMLSPYVKSSSLSSYLLKSDTSVFARKIALNNYLKISDTTAMLSQYAKKSQIISQVQSDWNASSGLGAILNKPTIPTNNNQLTNGSGYITSYTETDPNVPTYAKGLTSFSIIKSSTDPLYKPISYVPSWTEVTGKPTFFSGSYNDLTNKPTLVTQYGTTYTKEYNSKASTTDSSNEYTFNISSAGFSSIVSIQATGFYNGTNVASQPLISVKSYSTSSVTLIIAESANTNVLLGGTIEGLTSFLKSGEVFITVRGN